MSNHSRLTPVARAVAIAIVAAVVWSTVPASGARTDRLTPGDACKMVPLADVRKAFGSPVVEYPWSDVLGEFDCHSIVAGGLAAPTGGEFMTVQLFPGLPLGFDKAREVFEDQRAIDVLSEAEVVDLDGVGSKAFVNHTGGSVLVMASRKYVFRLVWVDAAPDAGLTRQDEKKLISLARKVVARAPK